ncbi:TonB-dependent receptor domain-containing protein [Sphingomonas canadensis]|uniref:TonB-dependent receptor domain-containing protein n=1 Tax=Sphingomonas canadensis TaxID=1219257 RepID=A0ABW3HFV5_9SPHN|nr:TonB-dependent receptor [Sphingomonas canadensis]MCW3837875.1 TonB-dependent receptor [Sphingomonas canadensis]
MLKLSLRGSSALQSLACAGLILTAAPAFAQDTSDDSAETLPETQADTSEATITVTGSRIRTVTPFNSPDPISVIDPAVAAKEGKTDLASMLQSSPIAAGSTQITSAISSNFVTNGGPGAQTIDLRGLGANRTLVLLNGRRAGPAGTRGGVSSFDLNVLPSSIASNVQILKTGASSVYGSDAVAGVVNIETKKDINGLQISGNLSAPFDQGGEQYRFNAIWGKTFERGNILIAADYTHVNELARGDRDYLACPEAYTFRQDGTRADLIDPRTGSYKCEDLRWGHVWTYNLIGNMQLDGAGGPNTGANTSIGGASVLMQYQYPGETLGIPAFGAPSFSGDFYAPSGWFATGYDTPSLAVQNAYHPFVEEQTIVPKTDLYTVFASGSYEITDSIELFGEFLFNRRETYQNGWRQFWNFGWTGDIYSTGAGNYFNYWGDGWGGYNFISPTAITNLSDNSQKVDYYRGVWGGRADLGGTWKIEAFGQYSRSIGRYASQQILQDVYDTGYFQYSSCVGTVTPISGKQCIDLPWTDPYFLAGQLTQAQADFLTSWEEGKTIYTQLTGEVSVTGELIQLPAGPLGIAAGVTARRDYINDVPGEITLAGNAWGASTSGITQGKSITTEAFAEANIPVLSDIPFIQNFTLSAAGRLTNVKSTRTSDGATDSDKGNWTYKLGANWEVTDWLRFRGSYGTSFRAPALFEQFLANETSFPSQRSIDPCINWAANLTAGLITQRIADNCSADGIPGNHSGAGVSATAVAQGGLGVLDPETSTALVVGGALTPVFDFLPSTKISVAVDYFNIRVKGEITQLGARNILYGCYGSLNFPTDPLCSLFTRGQAAAPNNVNQVFDKYVNIASQKNSGVDLAVNVRQDLGGLGTVSFTADMTWQIKDDSKLLPTSPLESDNGEAGSPSWVGDFRMSWTLPTNTTLFYGMNVIGGTSDVNDFLEDNGGNPCIVSSLRGTYCPDLTAPATFYHNFSLTQSFDDDRYELTLGVANIFDTRPPRVSVLNGSQISMLGPVVAASQYSFVGRRAFLNVSAKF